MDSETYRVVEYERGTLHRRIIVEGDRDKAIEYFREHWQGYETTSGFYLALLASEVVL